MAAKNEIYLPVPSGKVTTLTEGGVCLSVKNDSSIEIVTAKLDKGVFPQGDACDYALFDEGEGKKGCLVELKGSDEEKALKQLEHTYTKRLNEVPRLKAVSWKTGVVVVGGGNLQTAKWQKVLKKHRRTPLQFKQMGNNKTIAFSSLLL